MCEGSDAPAEVLTTGHCSLGCGFCFHSSLTKNILQDLPRAVIWSRSVAWCARGWIQRASGSIRICEAIMNLSAATTASAGRRESRLACESFPSGEWNVNGHRGTDG